MKDDIRSLLILYLLRNLELNPDLTISDATERVLVHVQENDFLTSDLEPVKGLFNQISAGLQRRGVLNPDWVARFYNVHFYFYLVNCKPGGLDSLINKVQSLNRRMSGFILYSERDSLILFSGESHEAEQFLGEIEKIAYEVIHFSARRVPLYHRYLISEVHDGEMGYPVQRINQIVDNYEVFQNEKDELEALKILLGPVWEFEEAPLIGVQAFVGIRLHGGSHRADSQQLLDAFLQNSTLRASLVHLFETDSTYPFHYFAKLVCKDSRELDEATNAISFTKINQVALETTTFVIASGRESLLTLPSDGGISIAPSLDLAFLPEMASQLLSSLGEDAIKNFNDTDPRTRLVIIKSLDELQRSAVDGSWDEERESGIQNALSNFKSSSLVEGEAVHMEGPVMQISKAVEGYLLHAIRRIADVALNGDYKRAQDEFRLPSRDFRKLTFGPAISALNTIKKHESCKFIADALTDSWIKRLGAFAEKRNEWAHSGERPERSKAEVIEEAANILKEGIAIIQWISSSIISTLSEPAQPEEPAPPIKLQPPRQQPGVFISYSSKDQEIVDKITKGLEAFGHRVWKDTSTLDPGNDFVEEIHKGLAQNDIFIIILSTDSVKSPWVKHELHTTIVERLSGRQIEIVPLVIEEIEVPPALKTIHHINMINDFEQGFLKLLDYLRRLKSN